MTTPTDGFRTNHRGGYDAFVAEVTEIEGTPSLLWLRYIGGTGQETARRLAPDKENGIFLAGRSTTASSVDFENTNHAVNTRKRGGSIVVRIPPDIIRKLEIKENELCLLLINKQEKAVCFKFISK